MADRRRRAWLACVLVAWWCGVAGETLLPRGAVLAAAQPDAPQVHEDATAAGGDEHAEGEEEHGSILEVVARLVNFGILAGGLFILLRVPVAMHLRDRSTQVRADLEQAEATSAAAAQQIEEIDRKLLALPGEIDALRARGRNEVTAEEARLQQSTEAERERLLEQSRREIALQLRIAKRDLIQHAAHLAVAVASRRIQESLTEIDQLRLVDRYVEQVTPEGRAREAGGP